MTTMPDGCGRTIGPYDCCTIVMGDARELAKAIPDESVDLIFTDPVYDRIEDYRWLAETARRVLRENAVALIWSNRLVPHQSICEEGGLTYQWTLYYTVQAKRGLCFHYGLFLWTTPCMVFAKGYRPANPVIPDTFIVSGAVDNAFKWNKNKAVFEKWMASFSAINDLILDPFTGSGTVPAVCKMLGRHYLAFEIDPDVAERARERVRNTQPPLFVMQPEQSELEFTTDA